MNDKALKKLPYGISNFPELISEDYAYIDKTRYIAVLENECNPYQFLLRPRRFGKSLFLSVLENYYDYCGKDKFESFFGNLYIGKNPTKKQGKYVILRFDFSGINTNNHEKFVESFSYRVQRSVQVFLERYANIFSNAADEVRVMTERNYGIGATDVAFGAAAKAGIPIFILIDEYDHFANNLIAMGMSYMDEVKAGDIVRAFYENLKAGTSSIVSRIFITGVSPMMFNDLSSGFNMAVNLSLDADYNEMFGFTSEEVELMINETGVDKNLIKVDMESYYNGYMFCKYGKDKVYNSQMILFLFHQILKNRMQPEQIVDPNLRTDYGRLRRLATNKRNREKLVAILKNGGINSRIYERFSIDQLNNDDYFISLLFYMGMLTCNGTYMGETILKIPNYSIRTLYWEYAVSYAQDMFEEKDQEDQLTAALKDMAIRGNISSYLDYFTENFLKRLSNRDLINFDEKYVKVMMLSTLFFSNLYLPVSEDENINGYTDIYLLKHPAIADIKYEYVFEIKYVKSEAGQDAADSAFSEALAQIEKYKKDARFTNRTDLKFAAIVFKGKGDYELREVE